MSVLVSALLAAVCLTATQRAPAPSQVTPTAAQERWLKSFAGLWVVDGATGADAEVVLNVTREGNVLVLKVDARGREIVTRYDLSGADAANRKSIFRTRIHGRKLVTEIWDDRVAGPPARIETRYMESEDRMVTELAKTPGGQVFNRTVLRRKAS